MADEIPAGQPPASAVIPAAAPAPASSLVINPETVATERAGKANSPAAIRSLLSDLRKAPAIKPAEVKPAEAAPAPEAVVEDPAAAPPAASEETPAPDAAATPAPESEAEEEDDGGEGPITPIAGSKTRLRLAETDKVGRLAASFMKRNRDMGMEEAVGKARNQLGIKTETAAPAAAPDPSKPQLPTTIEAVDAELERLTSEEDKATIELRFEDAIKSRKSQRDLNKHRATIERDAQRQQTQQAQEYDTAYGRSEQKAVELYEFAGNPESEGGKRMLEIEAALKENDDPLYGSPDKPLRVAQMVAAELKIAPKRKGQAAPAAKAPVPAAAPAQKKQVLPGGGSSTNPPAGNPTTAVAEQFGKITTVHQLRQALKPLTARR